MNLRPLVFLALVSACSPKADIVVTHGLLWTGLSTGRGQPGAVAIGDGKILAVSDSAGIARYIGSKTKVLDAHGGLVMPGFADGHTHFIDGGFQLAWINLRDAATPQEFVRRIKTYAATLKPGEWILGGDWDHTLWPGSPLPRHQWIDSVTPNNPVFVNRLDGHMALANAVAMRAAKVTKDTPAPVGGEVPRDARGEPIGIFKDNAEDLIGRAIPAPSAEQRDSALARALAHAASLGVTATGHMSASWADLASYKRLERAGRMTLRVALYLPIEDWRIVSDSVHRDGAGDDWVRIGGVKGYMDGSAGSRTAFFFEPFSDSAGYRGLMRQPESDMQSWVGAADSSGLKIAVHAIGDRANAIQDDLRLSHAARYRRAAGLRVRLDRRATGPDSRRVRRCHPPHARRQEPGWLGAGTKSYRRRGAARVHVRQCVGVVHGSEMGDARAESVCGRRGAGSRSVYGTARLDRRGESAVHDFGRARRLPEAVISRST